jgi:DNA-directed RNA polymerase subunit RPC12/RpoP
MIAYGCARCGVLLESPESLAGKPDKCPLCGQQNIVPPPKPAAKPVENEDAGPSGIGGWLIIAFLSFFLTPIDFIFGGFFPPWLWLVKGSAWVELIVFCIDLVMFLALFGIGIFFVCYRRSTVRAIIGFLIAGVVASLIKAGIAVSMWGGSDRDALMVFYACLQAGIWIPYFLRSRRVKNTFTE